MKVSYNLEETNCINTESNQRVKNELETIIKDFEKVKKLPGFDLKNPIWRGYIFHVLSMIGQLCKCLWEDRDFDDKGSLSWKVSSAPYRTLRNHLQHDPYDCFYDPNKLLGPKSTVKAKIEEACDSNLIDGLKKQLEYILLKYLQFFPSPLLRTPILYRSY